MEIIIKTKQTKNTQFNFLHFEDPLSNYYKHMVKMIKSGKYKPKDIKEEDNDKGKFEYLLHVKFTYEAKKIKKGWEVELSCSGRISSSCFTSNIHCVTVDRNGIFSSPCQRQCELLPSLGVRRLSSVNFSLFSSETP